MLRIHLVTKVGENDRLECLETYDLYAAAQVCTACSELVRIAGPGTARMLVQPALRCAVLELTSTHSTSAGVSLQIVATLTASICKRCWEQGRTISYCCGRFHLQSLQSWQAKVQAATSFSLASTLLKDNRISQSIALNLKGAHWLNNALLLLENALDLYMLTSLCALQGRRLRSPSQAGKGRSCRSAMVM